MNRTRHHPAPPPLHSIHRGIVTRLAPYGCFVQLLPSRSSGLVHISQLHHTKIDDVRNVVDVDGEVYVKIVEVLQDRDPVDEEEGGGRGRYRMKLSMKYVDQDDGTDLDPDQSRMERDLFHSKGVGGGGGAARRGEGMGGGGMESTLGRALSSHIGMSCAVDPGNLVLRGSSGGVHGGVTFNGYSLVGEEEGEAEIVLEEKREMPKKKEDSDLGVVETNMVKPMGRGRGSTLPAWMTRGEGGDRLGTMDRSLRVNRNDHESDKDDDDHSRGNSHVKKDKRQKHHKRHKKHKDGRRRRDRSPSYSSSSFRSDSPSPSRRRKRSHYSRSHKRRNERPRHGMRSPSRVRASTSKTEFANVEEARAVMEQLDRRRRER